MTDETRARFIGAIAKQVAAERVVEVHIFPAIRQGGVESGVAVIAVEREGVELAVVPDEAELVVVPEEEAADAKPTASRYTVYSAFYRHTLKGLERGKWEVSVTEEADAPLLTIDAVVRGVERRSGDADDTVRLSGDEFRAALPVQIAQSA